MKKQNIHRKSIVIFYTLVGYILLQITWWIYQIIQLALQIDDSGLLSNSKAKMLAGEFAVFFILFLVGIVWINRVFKNELKLSQSKENFSQSITHELKTPIATSILFIDTLLSRDLPKEKNKEILTKVLHEQNRLNDLIQKILLSSRLNNTEIKINKSPQNLRELLEKSILTYTENRNLNIEISKDIKINVDAFYFTSVFQNLHENAIKYSAEQTEIKWSATETNQHIKITVKDQGMGVPKDQLDKIFDMHYRAETENTRNVRGTGLGLFLVRKIIELHRGDIQVKSSTDKGTTFELTLPKT